MTEKEKIFSRIREALKEKAPFPAHVRSEQLLPTKNIREWLPRVGETFEKRLALFSKNARELKAEFELVEDWNKLSELLLRLRDIEGWKRIATHAGKLTDAASGLLGLPVCRTDRSYSTSELETCDVGLTECDALVAQTGSVLLTGRSAGGRALSVLPPHHMVLARREQLVADLSEAFTMLMTRYGGNYPSFISLITGPSRTGDIERVLVLGAHGPRKLTIFCF